MGATDRRTTNGLHTFSLASLLVSIFVAAMLAVANFRESRTVTEPYYAPLLGARWHPPPYAMREMAIDVHYDRGWPIWHARHTDTFAAHNASLYLDQDRRNQNLVAESEYDDLELFDVRQSGPLHYISSWSRGVFNAIFATAIVLISVIGNTAIERRNRRSRQKRTIS